MPSSTEKPIAKWHMIVFQYQLAGLAWALAVLAPMAPIIGQQRVIPPVLIWLFGMTSVPVFGYAGYLVFRSARALQTRDPNYPALIGPPSKVNCVIMGCGSLLEVAMGVSFTIEQQRPIFLALVVMGLYVLSLSACGFLWSLDARPLNK